MKRTPVQSGSPTPQSTKSVDHESLTVGFRRHTGRVLLSDAARAKIAKRRIKPELLQAAMDLFKPVALAVALSSAFLSTAHAQNVQPAPSINSAPQCQGWLNINNQLITGCALNFPNASGGILVTPSGGATASTLGALFGRTVSVLDYGAKCDGVTNDTAAFAAAIANLTAGGTVIVPAGACEINLTYSAAPVIRIIGQGEGASVLQPYTAGSAVITFTGGSNGSEIADLTITDGAATSGDGIDITGPGGITVRDVTISGFHGNGVSCRGSAPNNGSGNQILHSIILTPATANSGILLNDCNDTHITGNQIGVTPAVGSGNSSATAIDLTNDSGGNWINGNFIWQTGGGILTDNTSDLNAIVANRITQQSFQAINITGSNEITISSNQMYENSLAGNGSSQDIYLNGASYVTVTGNTTQPIGAVLPVNNLVISSDSAHIVIAGNAFYGNTSGPIGNSSGDDIHIGANGSNYPSSLPAYTTATLPTCGTVFAGFIAQVSDASSPTYNGTLSGGGSSHVPVYCNGTTWVTH